MKSLLFTKMAVLVVFLSLIFPDICNSQQVKEEEKPDFSAEFRAIVDSELALYNVLKSWIYFDAVKNEDGTFSYIRNEDKQKRISKDLFKGVEKVRFQAFKARFLERYRGEEKSLPKGLHKTVIFINKVYEHFTDDYKYLIEKHNKERKEFDAKQDSLMKEALDSDDSTSNILKGFKHNAPITTSELPDFIIPAIPVKGEYFSMEGGFSFLRNDESELEYPDVLDNFSEAEEKIMFKYFMHLLLGFDDELSTQYYAERINAEKPAWEKGKNKIAEKGYYYRLSEFSNNSSFLFRGVSEPDVFGFDNTLQPYFEPYWTYYEQMSEEEVSKINKKVGKAVEAKAEQGFSDWVLGEGEKKYSKEESVEMAKNGLATSAIINNLDFPKAFEADNGVTLKEFFASEFYADIDEKKAKFSKWFEEKYGIVYDQDTYNLVEDLRKGIKLNLLMKLYVESLFERARDLDPNFDLLEYVQKRTHLRLLAMIIESRLMFALHGLDSNIMIDPSIERKKEQEELMKAGEKEMLNK